MECRVCGAKLRKKGDLCPKCYKEMVEEEELKNDVVPILTVKRKYKPSFVLKQRWDVILIIVLVIATLVSKGHPLYAILSTILGFGVILGILAFDKMLSMKQKVVFYEKKVVKYSTVPFFGKTVEIPYKDIKDIVYHQTTWRHKRANMGDIVVYVKYTGYFGGLSLNNVENGKEIIQEMIEKLPINM